MQQQQLEIGGHQVYWVMHERTLLSDLKTRLEDIGFGNFAPEPRTDREVLRCALSDFYTTSGRREKRSVKVVPKKGNGPDNFVITLENPTKSVEPGDEWSKTKVLVHLEDGVLTLNPQDWMALEDINAGRAAEVLYVTKADMGKMMVDILRSMDCAGMMESGGLYWIRNEHYSDLRRVIRAVEMTVVRNPKDDNDYNKIYPQSLVADEDMVRACGDALTREIETAMKDIQDELEKGSLKEEACTNRIRTIGEMQAKIGRYEASFGVAYETLRKQTVEIAAAAANATLVSVAMSHGG